MTYTFYITTASSITYQVYPLNWLECSLVDEKEQDQQFYRRKFEGSLTFGGKKLCPDFTLFNGLDPCENVYFFIMQNTDIYWEGYFSTAMGEWDLDASTFTVTPLPLDDYSDWSESGDVEYDILSLGRTTTNLDDGVTLTSYTRTILLSTVINYLAQQVFGASVTVSSTFFNDATNPVTLASNRYNYLTIGQKSDIKRPASSNPATNGMMSFNSLMEILKCMNLRWSYDSSTDILAIEHISFWTNNAGLDIRTQEIGYASNKYRYLKEEMPKYETFKWMESYNDEFVGFPIWYDSLCVNQDSKSNTSEYITDVTTDIEYIIDCINNSEEDKISDEGWVLFANELRGPDLYVLQNAGVIEPGLVFFNNDLSWGVLHNNFFKHERQEITGYMNNTLTTFYSARKTRVQETNAIVCHPHDTANYDPNDYITTELGETYLGGEKGYVKKAVIKPYGEINFTLVYGPAGSDIVPVPETKIIRIIESGICGELHAILTPAADDDLDLYIGYEILDEFGVFVCGEDALLTPVWTIPAGSYTSDFTVSFDDPACGGGIPVGGCWNPVTNFDDAETKGWEVYSIVQDTDCAC